MRSSSIDDATDRLEALYREFCRDLLRHVACRLGWRRDEVEDGCQFAWTVLARRPDVLDGPSARGWLITVAARYCVAERREPAAPVDWLEHRPGPPLDDAIEARDALRSVAALRPARRRILERQLAGLSYAEIMAELDVTYTYVNRKLVDARAELRAAA